MTEEVNPTGVEAPSVKERTFGAPPDPQDVRGSDVAIVADLQQWDRRYLDEEQDHFDHMLDKE